MKNYYQILGLEEGATLDEIKAAYKEYVVKLHPDKHNGDSFFTERFQEIQEAYEHLIKGDNCLYNNAPQIVRFNLSSDEVIVKSKVTVSWETRFASHIYISIKTTNGIETYDNLSSKGEMIITPYSQDMNVGLTITAKNNISEAVSNKLLHLKYPPNQYNDSIGYKLIMWVIVIIVIIGIVGIIFNH